MQKMRKFLRVAILAAAVTAPAVAAAPVGFLGVELCELTPAGSPPGSTMRYRFCGFEPSQTVQVRLRLSDPETRRWLGPWTQWSAAQADEAGEILSWQLPNVYHQFRKAR